MDRGTLEAIQNKLPFTTGDFTAAVTFISAAVVMVLSAVLKISVARAAAGRIRHR